jgi:predicted nucleic acid-binding protein
VQEVFVDTSGFYAHLDATDPFHAKAATLFQVAAESGWLLLTTNYVVLETVALVQSRLGWEAVEAWQQRVLPRCRTHWVDESLHRRGEARWAQARERRLSLTDCISFEFMRNKDIREAIAQDEHFARAGITLPHR